LDIQRNERSTCVVDGASGQLENRVTSGADNSARNAGASFGVAARNVSRLVDKVGNFRLAVGGMASSPFDFARQTFSRDRLQFAMRSRSPNNMIDRTSRLSDRSRKRRSTS
jgi:hypothetical protein